MQSMRHTTLMISFYQLVDRSLKWKYEKKKQIALKWISMKNWQCYYYVIWALTEWVLKIHKYALGNHVHVLEKGLVRYTVIHLITISKYFFLTPWSSCNPDSHLITWKGTVSLGWETSPFLYLQQKSGSKQWTHPFHPTFCRFLVYGGDPNSPEIPMSHNSWLLHTSLTSHCVHPRPIPSVSLAREVQAWPVIYL